MIPGSAASPPTFSPSILLRRVLLLFLLPHAIFAGLALPTAAPWLIAILNGSSLALSMGVCVAFLPAMFGIFFKPGALDRGDYLSFGIWLTWFAVIMQAIWSMIWRWRGMPLWMADTDFTSYFLFMRVCGAVFHLAAPGAIDNHIPPRRWIMIGILIALAVIAVMLAGWMLDVVAVDDIGRMAMTLTG